MSSITTFTESHWCGNNYKNISMPLLQMNQDALNLIDFFSVKEALDIGCGSGETTKIIAMKNDSIKITAIDANRSMIDTAQEISMPNIHFLHLPVENISFDKKFNLVTCFFCMHWIKNKVFVMQKIYHALKLNGNFLMASPLPHPFLPKIREQLITSSQWEKYFINYTDPLIYINDCDYENYTQQAKLSIELNNKKLNRVFFESRSSFHDFLVEMTPCVPYLPTKDIKNIFIQELIDLYQQACPLENNLYYLDFNMIVLKATKLVQ